jgi:hypothetical protein
MVNRRKLDVSLGIFSLLSLGLGVLFFFLSPRPSFQKSKEDSRRRNLDADR